MKSRKDRTDINNAQGAVVNDNIENEKHDINIISINLAIFSLFLALVFSYFIYFSHQLTEVKSEIFSKIIEINAIETPHPLSFLSITGHKEYYYLARKEILLDEFENIKLQLFNPNINENELRILGSKIQVLITQIAYFFPYKRMLDFQKDGGVNFDPNHFESIESEESLESNIPSYKISSKSSKHYNIEFLKEQMNEIIYFQRRFTLNLKDAEGMIISSMMLADTINEEYDKSRLKMYIESLIIYLDKHYELAIPFGLTIKKYDYLLDKSNTKLIIELSCLISLNYILGIIVPLFIAKTRNKKIFWALPQIMFILGMIILLSESFYSLSI